MRKSKTAQTAMEFLMTYGWAILVVLVVLGALVFFGVLNPEKLMPDRCSFPSEFMCIGKPLVQSAIGDVQIALKNNGGFPITVQSISGTDDCATNPSVKSIGGTLITDAEPFNYTMTAGEQAVFIIDCSNDGITSGRFKADFTITYRDSNTGIIYPITGEVRATAK